MKLNNTLKNLIILFLGITIVALIVFRPSKEVLSDFHLNKYKEYQTTKDSLLNEIKQQDKEIINLIKKYETIDSIYDGISKRDARKRATDIFRFKP
jgi:hypothetical protein